MRIAVTGANGFVGSYLAGYLRKQGHEVVAIIRHNSDTSLLDPVIQTISVDYNSPVELNSALQDVEILIHNAGKTRTCSYNEMLQANVVITRNILSVVNSLPGFQQLIYISSQAASRPSENRVEVTEEDASAPVTWYGRSKLLAERIIKAECKPAWTIVRPVPVYGEGDRDFLELFKLLKLGINFRIGSRDKQMNLIHVEQLCDFIALCLQNEQAYNQVFFASDGQRYTQAQFTALASKLLNRPGFQITIPLPLAKLVFAGGELMTNITKRASLVNAQKMREILAESWICSISKARERLNWNPDKDMESRLREALDWYRTKGWL